MTGGGLHGRNGTWSRMMTWVIEMDGLFLVGCGFAGYSHCAQGSLARMVSVKICPSYLGE